MKPGQTIEENLQQKLRSYERPLLTRRDLTLQLMFMVAIEILIPYPYVTRIENTKSRIRFTMFYFIATSLNFRSVLGKN